MLFRSTLSTLLYTLRCALAYNIEFIRGERAERNPTRTLPESKMKSDWRVLAILLFHQVTMVFIHFLISEKLTQDWTELFYKFYKHTANL